VSALPTEALNFSHRYALYTDVSNGLADVIELERLDDCSDHFHFDSPVRRLKVE
jgi:hypothetical protein